MWRFLAAVSVVAVFAAVVSIDSSFAYYPLGNAAGYPVSVGDGDVYRAQTYGGWQQGAENGHLDIESVTEGLPGVEEEAEKNWRELHRLNERRVIHERYS